MLPTPKTSEAVKPPTPPETRNECDSDEGICVRRKLTINLEIMTVCMLHLTEPLENVNER